MREKVGPTFVIGLYLFIFYFILFLFFGGVRGLGVVVVFLWIIVVFPSEECGRRGFCSEGIHWPKI